MSEQNFKNLIKTTIKNTPTHIKYSPHVTIAYTEKGKYKNLIGNETFNKEKWTAKSVIFSSKTGEKTKIPLNKI